MSTAAAADRIDPARLLAFFAMVCGMFMAILDIQIVSASLTEIQAGLAASADEIAYVQTSYLVGEVIMIPLSGFLARVVSTRWMFTISAGGFTIASVFCGMATTALQLVLARIGVAVGEAGAGPASQSIVSDLFAPKERALPMAMLAVGPNLGIMFGFVAGIFLLSKLLPGRVDYGVPHQNAQGETVQIGYVLNGLSIFLIVAARSSGPKPELT